MRNRILLTASLSLMPLAAMAHVTLTENSAAPGAHYLAHFRIGHGCDGSPTTGLSIAIPDGVSGVAPEPAPGWTVETEQAGGKISAVTWKGGLLDAKTPGEFAVAMTLPSKAGPLVFAATQTCTSSGESWSEIPVPGQKSTHPAPVLYVGVAPPKTDGMAPGMVMPPGSHM
jgi:uncharacterized protein YcnI